MSGATLAQNVIVTDNAIADNAAEGIWIAALGAYDAAVTQTVSIAGNTITDNGDNAIGVFAYNSFGVGRLAQTVTISGNSLEPNLVIGHGSKGVYVWLRS